MQSNLRLKLYLLFSLALIGGAFVSSMAAVIITGSRGSAGLGMLIGLPIIQLIFSFKLIKTSTIKTLLIVIVVSAITHFSSLYVTQVWELRLGLDYYGYFDFLVIYALFSIVTWEVINVSISKIEKNKNI